MAFHFVYENIAEPFAETELDSGNTYLGPVDLPAPEHENDGHDEAQERTW